MYAKYDNKKSDYTMNQRRIFFVGVGYILIDILVIYLSIFIACLIRSNTLYFPLVFVRFLIDPTNAFRFIFLFWIFVMIVINSSQGLYKTRREMLEGVEIWAVIKSVCLSATVVIVALYILKIEGLPRSIFIIATMSMMILLSTWRVLKRVFVEYLVRGGYNNINALIVGAGKVGLALSGEIRKRPGLGIKIIGFLDDLKVNNPENKDAKILGKISDFIKVVQREFVSKVFITIHHDSKVFLRLLEDAKKLNIPVRVVPQGFELSSGEFLKYNIGFVPILEYSEAQILRKQAGKRLFDFCVSLLVLLLLVPIFIVMGILIKVDSPGPIFYKSKRYGRKGKMFNMLKFRSMVKDADISIDQIRHKNEVDGPIFKIRNDPRITKTGRFLRRYSLDELPQFINVLVGEMSLVGPRPLPIDQIEKEDLRQLKRLEIRPGITGLWQIRGRSDVSFPRLLKWDIWYINNWSFWLDLNILFQTIPVVVKGRGAY